MHFLRRYEQATYCLNHALDEPGNSHNALLLLLDVLPYTAVHPNPKPRHFEEGRGRGSLFADL